MSRRWLGQLTLPAALVFILLLIGYAYVGMSLKRTYDGETALAQSLARTSPLWQAVRMQPVDEPGPLRQQITLARQQIARQQALFPKEAEVISHLDAFLAQAQRQSIQVLKLDAQAASQKKTAAGVYQVARYTVRARGSWLSLAPLFRRMAEQGQFGAMGFENLAIVTATGGPDDLGFDLLIYLRTS